MSAPRRGDRAWTLAPALVLFGAIALFPVALLVAMSFSNVAWVQGRAQWSFAGAAQYARVLQDELFRAGIGNTLLFACTAVALQMLIGFALALAVTRIGRGRTLYRTVLILPILVPGIVIGAMWKLMYNFDFGVLNQMLDAVGVRGVDWLGNPATALAAVIAVDVWHWTPFVFLLLLAGLESLPQDVYEAARIDGASFLQELRHVTLPLMLPAIAVTVVFRVISGVKVFDEIYLLTGGGPGTATEVVSYSIFRRFFTEGQVGYGAAMSTLVLFTLALAFIVARGLAARRSAAP